MSSKPSSKRFPIPVNGLQNAKNKESQEIKKRMDKRIALINNTINKMATNNHLNMKSYINGFIINDSQKQILTQCAIDQLLQWNGGGPYKRPIINDKQCRTKVSQYWNREKAKNLGNGLFCPVLCQLFKHLVKMNNNLSIHSQQDMVLLFIDTFNNLLSEKIKFERTKPNPLILTGCFFKSKKLKDFCSKFIECFGQNIEWNEEIITKYEKQNGKVRSIYIRDDQRSQKKHDQFGNILDEIRKQLIQRNDSNFIPTAVQRFIQWIDSENNELILVAEYADDEKKVNPLYDAPNKDENVISIQSVHSVHSVVNYPSSANQPINTNLYNHCHQQFPSNITNDNNLINGNYGNNYCGNNNTVNPPYQTVNNVPHYPQLQQIQSFHYNHIPNPYDTAMDQQYEPPINTNQETLYDPYFPHQPMETPPVLEHNYNASPLMFRSMTNATNMTTDDDDFFYNDYNEQSNDLLCNNDTFPIPPFSFDGIIGPNNVFDNEPNDGMLNNDIDELYNLSSIGYGCTRGTRYSADTFRYNPMNEINNNNVRRRNESR